MGLQRQSSNISPPPTLPPPSSLEAYREPLPPIVTPGSSRAHSPDSPFAQLTLPPLDPSLYGGSHSHGTAHHHGRIHHHPHHVRGQPYAAYTADRERERECERERERERDWDRGSANDGTQSRAGEAARDLHALSLSTGVSSQYAATRLGGEVQDAGGGGRTYDEGESREEKGERKDIYERAGQDERAGAGAKMEVDA